MFYNKGYLRNVFASQKKVVHCLKLELEAYRNALTNGTRFSVTSGQYFSPRTLVSSINNTDSSPS
jgi:hypothetical protein